MADILVRVAQEPPVLVSVGELTTVAGDDYTGLRNKPRINSVELLGDKTGEELGLQDEMEEFSNAEVLAMWNSH